MAQNISLRKQYLLNIGIKHDPFITPVAEQEMINETGDIPLFFSFYVQPKGRGHSKLKVIDLRHRQHSFIYGNPGDGKSTLRLATEANLRILPDESLVITYLLGEDVNRPLTPAEHGSRLAQALAIDFFIQTIEQMTDAKMADLAAQIEDLRLLLQMGGPNLRRMLTALAEEILDNRPASEATRPYRRAGLGVYWKRVGRYPVRYVAPGETLMEFLKALLKKVTPKQALPTGLEAFWQGIAIARAAGHYQQIYIMSDGVDARLRDPAEMIQQVLPILELFPEAEKQKIYFKLFLPLEIRVGLSKFCQALRLQSPILDVTIIWNKPALQQLITQRFRAGGSQVISSLDMLADDDLKTGLEQPLFQLAKGSPRRLLELVSALIDHHATRAADQMKINQADWEAMQKTAELLVG